MVATVRTGSDALRRTCRRTMDPGRSPRATALVMYPSVITVRTDSRVVRRMSAMPKTLRVEAGRTMARRLASGSSKKGTYPPIVKPRDHTEKT